MYELNCFIHLKKSANIENMVLVLSRCYSALLVLPRAVRWSLFIRCMFLPFIGVSFFALEVRCEELAQVNDRNLTTILSELEILYEEHLNSGLDIKLFIVNAPGECDPHREATTCPHSEILIVSALDEGGLVKPTLWKTRKLIGWKLLGRATDNAPNTKNGYGESAYLLKACEASADVESGKVDPRDGGWWREVQYRLTVESNRAELKKIENDNPDKMCDLY